MFVLLLQDCFTAPHAKVGQHHNSHGVAGVMSSLEFDHYLGHFRPEFRTPTEHTVLQVMLGTLGSVREVLLSTRCCVHEVMHTTRDTEFMGQSP